MSLTLMVMRNRVIAKTILLELTCISIKVGNILKLTSWSDLVLGRQE